MERIRTPFQGIGNIIRFNWHFYLIAFGLIVFIILSNKWVNETLRLLSYIAVISISISTLISLLVSYYVYDVSDLYQLKWLEEMADKPSKSLVNIHAGFDETSVLLKDKFPDASLTVFDFYDPLQHTEVSIKRARKANPPFPQTQAITTTKIPLHNEAIDKIFVILSAHEIRDNQERIAFFKELNRILAPNGQLVVTEHLRDLPNFLALGQLLLAVSISAVSRSGSTVTFTISLSYAIALLTSLSFLRHI